jgi:hypothetical protein
MIYDTADYYPELGCTIKVDIALRRKKKIHKPFTGTLLRGTDVLFFIEMFYICLVQRFLCVEAYCDRSDTALVLRAVGT